MPLCRRQAIDSLVALGLAILGATTPDTLDGHLGGPRLANTIETALDLITRPREHNLPGLTAALYSDGSAMDESMLEERRTDHISRGVLQEELVEHRARCHPCSPVESCLEAAHRSRMRGGCDLIDQAIDRR
jgi:hypothetical protein